MVEVEKEARRAEITRRTKDRSRVWRSRLIFRCHCMSSPIDRSLCSRRSLRFWSPMCSSIFRTRGMSRLPAIPILRLVIITNLLTIVISLVLPIVISLVLTIVISLVLPIVINFLLLPIIISLLIVASLLQQQQQELLLLLLLLLLVPPSLHQIQTMLSLRHIQTRLNLHQIPLLRFLLKDRSLVE